MSTESVRYRFIRTQAGAKVIYALIAVTMLVGPIAFIEPSPYEGAVFVLAVAAFLFGLPFERRILPLLLLLMAWAAGGFLSLVPAFDDPDAVRYYAISVYLMVTTIVFACLFAEDTMGRLIAFSDAYIFAAFGVSCIAIAAYFGAIPGSESFMVNGRASGTFKDPNVFAPYLILPLLFLIQRTIYRGFGVVRLTATMVILLALFLSFSRGAWGHFVLSAVVMVGLLFAGDMRRRFRRRMVLTAIGAVVGVALLIPASLSIPSVQEMFEIRAELLQSYDSSERTGRFGRQIEAAATIIEEPNGLGPMQFGLRFGQDVHNVYLNAFVAYGWIGGFAYLAIVILTLVRGFGAVFRESPWRAYIAAVYATFVGLALEGLIVDTDHWRHFFLLVGLIWGLSAATAKYQERLQPQHAVLSGSGSRSRRPALAPAVVERAPRLST